MSVVACCRTNQTAQVEYIALCIITNSQLANFLAPKQTLLVADNVINTYNYPIYWPPKVNLTQFSQWKCPNTIFWRVQHYLGLDYHPAASLLANFNDILSMISTIWLIYISCSHQDKNHATFVMASQLTLFGESTVNTKSTRGTYTRESKVSVVAVPRYQLFTQRLHR